MGDGQRDRCLVNGCEREGAEVARGLDARRDSLKSREKFGAAAASLKPSVRVTISVGGLGLAQVADGGSAQVDGGSGGGVAARGSSLRAQEVCSERVVGRQMVVGRQRQWRQQQLVGRCRLCPVGQACAVPCVQGRPLVPPCFLSGLWELVHAVGRGRNETRRAVEGGRSVGEKARD